MSFPSAFYNDYSSYIRSVFGERVQKISLNTGFSCPNRDGTKGIGGCTYCNNRSFSPEYSGQIKSVEEQLKQGIAFFSAKYKAQKYLAYFQSYTNTYADVELLKAYYLAALDYPGVVGLVIGTRPDCISDSIIDFISELAKNYYVALEFGVETTLNRSLKVINRCHTFEETVAAYEQASNRGIYLGAHLILGLPGESRADMLNHASRINQLPIATLKIHHLQIIKNTMMAYQYKNTPEMFNLFDLDEYVDLVTEFISRLRPDIVLERFISESPADLLIAPQWGGAKNFEVLAKIARLMEKKNLRQGCYNHVS
jgi:uncharacterized protein